MLGMIKFQALSGKLDQAFGNDHWVKIRTYLPEINKMAQPLKYLLKSQETLIDVPLNINNAQVNINQTSIEAKYDPNLGTCEVLCRFVSTDSGESSNLIQQIKSVIGAS